MAERAVPIVLSVDYEVFGDGTGDPLALQVATVDKLLAAIEPFAGKLTVFVEFGQLDHYRRHPGHPRHREYLDAIEAQLENLIATGHDVQLHLHPTWLGSTMAADGSPVLNLAQDDITALPEAAAVAALAAGRTYLEDLLRRTRPQYECMAFRAGAFTAVDQRRYCSLLRQAGLRVDSSVVPGGHLVSGYGNFDYRRVPNSAPFRFSASILEPDERGDLVEFPVLTETGPLSTLRYRNAHGRRNREMMHWQYREKLTDAGRNRAFALLRKLTRGYALADFNFLGAHELAAVMRKAVASADSAFPLMLIGHSKFSHFNDELLLLDRHLRNDGIVPRYLTLAECAREFACP